MIESSVLEPRPTCATCGAAAPDTVRWPDPMGMPVSFVCQHCGALTELTRFDKRKTDPSN